MKKLNIGWNRKTLIWGAVILLVILVVGVQIGKKKEKGFFAQLADFLFGSNPDNKPPTQAPYPDQGATLPAGGRPILDTLVVEIYDVLDGFDWSQSKELTFQRLKSLTNDQLTYVYNAWNAKYQAQEGVTLTQRIKDETFPTTAMTDAIAKFQALQLF